MFSNACDLFLPLFGGVGSITAGQPPGPLVAVACRISKSFVLTAQHVIAECANSGSLTSFIGRSGLLTCVPAWEDIESDIAILRVRHEVPLPRQPTITQFPVLPTAPTGIGSSVGYLSILRRIDQSGDAFPTAYFGQASVSTIETRERNNLRFMLSDGIMQSGFSGSPVFTSDGTIQGVIVQTVLFPTVTGLGHQETQIKPVFSSIWPFVDRIQTLVDSEPDPEA